MDQFRIPQELASLLAGICDAQDTAYQNLATTLHEVVGCADAASKCQLVCTEARTRLQKLVDGHADWSEVCPTTSKLIAIAIEGDKQSSGIEDVSADWSTFKNTEIPQHIEGIHSERDQDLKERELAVARVIEDHCRRVTKREAQVTSSVAELKTYKHVFAFTEDVLSFVNGSPENNENAFPEQVVASEGVGGDRSVQDNVQNEIPSLLTACEDARKAFDAKMTSLGIEGLHLLPAVVDPTSPETAEMPKRKLSSDEPSGLLNFGNCPSVLRGARGTPRRLTVSGELSPITQTEVAMRSPRRASLSPLNVAVKDRLKGRLTLDARKVFEEEKALAMLDDWGQGTATPTGKKNRSMSVHLADAVGNAAGGGEYSFRETAVNTARFGESPSESKVVPAVAVPKRRMSLTAKALHSIAALEPHLLLN